MEALLYVMVRVLVGTLQALPLSVVARMGRAGGAVAWVLDGRHRKVVLENLALAFSEKGSADLKRIGRENMRRIGENYAAAIKTSSLSVQETQKICEVVGLEKFPSFPAADGTKNCIVAIGHFGNFEVNAIMGKLVPGCRPATTYRGLKQPAFNALMKALREKSGCVYYERRSEGEALREALKKGGLLLGLLSDQHGGNSGVWGPFMGRTCSTTPAPAVFALRYDAPLFTAICYRTGLGRWRIEVGDEIPTEVQGKKLSVEEITAEINRAFEAAVRRDPANWFWVHKRWKPMPKKKAGLKPASEEANRGGG